MKGDPRYDPKEFRRKRPMSQETAALILATVFAVFVVFVLNYR